MMSVISAFFSFLVRIVLAVATLVLVLFLLSVAVISMLGLLLWSLIRGRRPTVDLSGFARARQFRAGAGFARARAASADVVDVEVREVREVRPGAPRLE
ncbi:MAG: hypothetical protein C0423_08330 [Methylibium sp.]|nr:hypothetical protein [Methylibium sp.]